MLRILVAAVLTIGWAMVAQAHDAPQGSCHEHPAITIQGEAFTPIHCAPGIEAFEREPDGSPHRYRIRQKYRGHGCGSVIDTPEGKLYFQC